MNKRVLILVSVILTLLVAILIWFFFFRSSATPPGSDVQNVLPFGSGDGTVNNSNLNNPNDPTSLEPGSGQALPYLFKISEVPVAGGVSIIKDGFPIVRYVERATGHIVDVSPTTLERIKIVNTTIPKVYNAVFKKNGSAVVMQTLPGNGEIVESVSYALLPPKATSTSVIYTTIATPLPRGMNEIAAGVNNIFFTTKEGPGIISSLFDSTKSINLFAGAFNEWILNPVNDGLLAITTKASAQVPGYAYLLTNNGSLSKLLGPLAALMINVDQKGERVLYGRMDQTTFVLSALNIKSDSNIAISPTTLPEKCVWGVADSSIIYCGVPRGGVGPNQPDSWYSGKTHYSDNIWVINVDTTFASMAAEPKKNFGVDIDVMNPFLSPDEDYLFFTNKNDLTLWALKLN